MVILTEDGGINFCGQRDGSDCSRRAVDLKIRNLGRGQLAGHHHLHFSTYCESEITREKKRRDRMSTYEVRWIRLQKQRDKYETHVALGQSRDCPIARLSLILPLGTGTFSCPAGWKVNQEESHGFNKPSYSAKTRSVFLSIAAKMRNMQGAIPNTRIRRYRIDWWGWMRFCHFWHEKPLVNFEKPTGSFVPKQLDSCFSGAAILVSQLI